MRTAAELEPVAFQQELTAEEDDVLFQHYSARATDEKDTRILIGDLKHAAFFACRAFDKGERGPEKLSEYFEALNAVQKLAPTRSFRRKLNEIKSLISGKGATKILKRLARLGNAGSSKVLASAADLDAIEETLDSKLPPSYRQYLMQYANRQIGTYEPYAAGDLIGAVQEARDNGLDSDLLPFLEDNADLFCFDLTSRGPEYSVVFQPHDGTSDESWPNFSAWVEECWLGELED